MSQTSETGQDSAPAAGSTTNKVRNLLVKIEPWQAVAALLIAFAGGVTTSVLWIRTAAREAVLEEKFLSTLAAAVRPTMIFDSKGSVELDQGAGEYVDAKAITIKKAPEYHGFEIILKGKKHLANKPVIEGLDSDLVPRLIERGTGYDWKIEVEPRTANKSIWIGAAGEPKDNMEELYRFRLEILH